VGFSLSRILDKKNYTQEDEMKIKDLPKDTDLRGVKFYDPKTKITGFWFSQWVKGIWWKLDMKSTQVFPLCLDDLTEALEFDVIEEGENG
jgi:hypothetical protein